MDPRASKSFDFAADLVKQLITLSTAVIAITITFSKDIVGAGGEANNVWLISAWLGFFLAIIFGVWALMALTGSLAAPSGSADLPERSIGQANCQVPVGLQILSFLVAMGLTIAYAVQSL